MTAEQFDKQRFSIKTMAKIINDDDLYSGETFKIGKINFDERLIGLIDADGDMFFKRCENIEIIEPD